jgi:hypothetical protein
MDFEKEHYFCSSPATGTNFNLLFCSKMVRPEQASASEIITGLILNHYPGSTRQSSGFSKPCEVFWLGNQRGKPSMGANILPPLCLGQKSRNGIAKISRQRKWLNRCESLRTNSLANLIGWLRADGGSRSTGGTG